MKRCVLSVLLSFFIMNLSSQTPASANNCSAKEYRQFDFWIGSWDVTNPNGSPAGTNTIEKVQNGCVLKENWTSASAGYTGTSYNFYNATKKQWEQIWLDNQGGNLHLKGHRKGNQMILRSDEFKNAQGKNTYHQITWTANDDGTVRQYWETFTEGSDVTVAFNGLYKKEE